MKYKDDIGGFYTVHKPNLRLINQFKLERCYLIGSTPSYKTWLKWDVGPRSLDHVCNYSPRIGSFPAFTSLIAVNTISLVIFVAAARTGSSSLNELALQENSSINSLS